MWASPSPLTGGDRGGGIFGTGWSFKRRSAAASHSSPASPFPVFPCQSALYPPYAHHSPRPVVPVKGIWRDDGDGLLFLLAKTVSGEVPRKCPPRQTREHRETAQPCGNPVAIASIDTPSPKRAPGDPRAPIGPERANESLTIDQFIRRTRPFSAARQRAHGSRVHHTYSDPGESYSAAVAAP